MITGAIVAVLGLVIGLNSSFRFNLALMLIGWLIFGVGFIIFLLSAFGPPP